MQNFGTPAGNNNEGVANHNSGAGWTIEANTIQRNAGAGVMIGSDNKLLNNCLRDNGQYGFNAYHPQGVQGVELRGNEITGNNTDDWEKRQPGCGCTGGGKFWDVTGGVVVGNYVHNNRGVGLWADSNNSGFRFEGNHIEANDAEGIFYETSYNAAIVNNTFVRNGLVKGPTNPGFPTGAIYLSEAGSDTRVAGPFNTEFRIAGNTFSNNWSGVIAWENADRFAGSAANTSTGHTTKVNPDATLQACSDRAKIGQQPFVDDCRWKTQNLVIERNTFEIQPDQLKGCTPATGCGFNGLFSNFGTFPEWSPYKGEIVARAITFEQNNRWLNNTYVGPWRFVAELQDKNLSWEQWRAAPYNQDAGSTLR